MSVKEKLSQIKVKSEQQKKEPENQRARARKQVYKVLWKEQVAGSNLSAFSYFTTKKGCFTTLESDIDCFFPI